MDIAVINQSKYTATMLSAVPSLMSPSLSALLPPLTTDPLLIVLLRMLLEKGDGVTLLDGGRKTDILEIVHAPPGGVHTWLHSWGLRLTHSGKFYACFWLNDDIIDEWTIVSRNEEGKTCWYLVRV